jgi:type IV pilus assembly protein PilA
MKRQLQKRFTLIELMIVVAIIGILAAVAIPAYQDYIARSQVSEAVTLLGGAKTPVSEYIADRGEAPTASGVFTDVVNTTTGKYVASITINGDATNITLTATMRTSGVNNAIQGSTLLLVTSDGGRNWTCTGAPTGSVLAKYRSAACRQ